jgi:hypothetical protein
MAKYKVVQFPDNTYGVLKKGWFSKSYLSIRNWNNWWSDDEWIYASCRFEKLCDAQNALNFVKREFKEFNN